MIQRRSEDYFLSRLLAEHVKPRVAELCELIRAALQPFEGPNANSMYLRDENGRIVLDISV